MDAVVAGREGVVGRQARLGTVIAAGEVDRAAVAGGRVAELVQGRDRDAEGVPPWLLAGALTVKWVAGGRG